MIDRFVDRLNKVNTTSARILASVFLAGMTIAFLLVGILWRNWLPTDQQLTVLKGIGLFLALMMGLDVMQFASKRFSDEKYVAAKNPTSPSPVTVESGPTSVTVTQETPPDNAPVAAPEVVTVAAVATPAQPATLTRDD
jgi:xanthine/uracil/vitamin C permease (AzgA family)